MSASGSLSRAWSHGGEHTVILDSAPEVTLEQNLREGTRRSEPLEQ